MVSRPYFQFSFFEIQFILYISKYYILICEIYLNLDTPCQKVKEKIFKKFSNTSFRMFVCLEKFDSPKNN